MNSIIDLQNQYAEMLKSMSDLTDIIIKHFHDYYDSKLDSFKTFDEFLEDINNYADSGTLGKLLYIKYVSDTFEKR